jgi:hypothetical protein
MEKLPKHAQSPGKLGGHAGGGGRQVPLHAMTPSPELKHPPGAMTHERPEGHSAKPGGQTVTGANKPLHWHAETVCASMDEGATNELTIGNATIEVNPIFLITSRREKLSKGEATSSALLNSFSFFSLSIATHTKSSFTSDSSFSLTTCAISEIEFFPSQACQITADASFKQRARWEFRS